MDTPAAQALRKALRDDMRSQGLPLKKPEPTA